MIEYEWNEKHVAKVIDTKAKLAKSIIKLAAQAEGEDTADIEAYLEKHRFPRWVGGTKVYGRNYNIKPDNINLAINIDLCDDGIRIYISRQVTENNSADYYEFIPNK